MSHFKHHVFFCCNQREPGANCCNNHGAQDLRAVLVQPAGPDQIVVGISSRGGQLRMIVGRPNSDENSQVPRSAEVPTFGFETSFIGQNLVEI